MNRCLLVALLLVRCTAPAAELQAEGAVDTRIGLGQRWDVILHNRARVHATTGEWFDVSLVPIFRYRAHPRVRVLAGHFFTGYDFEESGWSREHRPFFGAEAALPREHFTLASRTLMERFFLPERSDFNRYRQRFRIIGRHSLTPYGNVEFFMDARGLRTVRYGTGVRKNLGKLHGIEFSYWYETAKLTGGGVRHVIVMTFHVNFRGLAPDI